jgi:multiple sugar transport system ATP-binding protein
MAAIALQNVSKVFPNGTAVLCDLSLTIADGELLVVLGPSGSGKSTVLRLIAGLEAPTGGSILIDGRDVTSVPPQSRDLAMVFQSYALYPHKTVRENLAFGLRLRRAERVDERVAAVAAMLGIGGLLDRKPAQLSGGQRQRVALGRAIIREPQAFLLDEPLSNLDPLLRVSTRAELALLHRRLGTTTVYVTHDQEEAMTLGTRIAVLAEGRLEQVDTPLEVFQHPANTFVARFVGSPEINLWPGTVSKLGDRVQVRVPKLSLDLAIESLDIPQDGPITVGVRPHDIELSDPESGDGRGRIVIVEPLGSATLVHLQMDHAGEDLIRVIVPPDDPVAVDMTRGLRIRRDRLHLFDGHSGLRLERAQGA